MIDYIKSKARSDNFSYFIFDQIAHVLVIVILCFSVEHQWTNVRGLTQTMLQSNRVWPIILGYTFVSWPLGIIIGKATQKWRDQINQEKQDVILATDGTPPSSNEEQELGLASAGKWIGICERILILTFVLMSQYTAIGFLMTAKSILRFSEKEINTQLKTEYVLVGTLVSFAASALTGVLIQVVLLQ